MLTLIVAKILNTATLPTRGSGGAANYDLYSAERLILYKGETELVGTGLVVRVPEGHVLEIYSRSGLASKGVQVANAPGQVDSDYRGEVKVLLYNSDNLAFEINQGDRIAQCRIVPILPMCVEEVEHIDPAETQRGAGGFGSTGV